MREIKFRVWDKKNKCWFKHVFEAYKGNLYDMLLGLSGSIHIRTMEGLFHESISEYADRYVLQQFTGLPDKNRKEIYEGDICTINGDDDAWNDVVVRDKNWLELSTYKNRCVTNCSLYDLHNQLEVIGNIYEHANLLTHE